MPCVYILPSLPYRFQSGQKTDWSWLTGGQEWGIQKHFSQTDKNQLTKSEAERKQKEWDAHLKQKQADAQQQVLMEQTKAKLSKEAMEAKMKAGELFLYILF